MADFYFAKRLYNAYGVCMYQARNLIARLLKSTHDLAPIGLNPGGISPDKYINRQPCAPSIFISRIDSFIFTILPGRTN